MANTQQTGPRYEYATITEAPGASGSWCNAVSMTGRKTDELFVSISGGGSATVTMQYKLPHSGAAWVDYTTSETLESGARFRLDDHGAGIKWRVGVKQGGYSSGTVIVGLDW